MLMAQDDNFENSSFAECVNFFICFLTNKLSLECNVGKNINIFLLLFFITSELVYTILIPLQLNLCFQTAF